MSNWLRTRDGQPRGHIQPGRLDELWFHTGTNCNLRCPFCLEGSRPGDRRLDFITVADAEPYIAEALGLGVKEFSFTGGEPFTNPEMVALLDLALRHRPCLVLTNGTNPLRNRLGSLLALRDLPHPLSLRISLDYPDEQRHDAGRGRGKFRQSLRGLRQLHEAGFHVSVARLMPPDEDRPAVEAAYRQLFTANGLPPETRIVAFPDFHRPGEHPDGVPEITETCMTTYLTADQRQRFMCNFSKMIVKRDGRCAVYACTLVDDDPDYALATTLREAMATRVMLKHHRCYACFAYGASCSEIQ